MNSSRTQGFTFLELIIGLTILSLVMLVVYSALNLGLQIADRGEARGLENQRARAALALIARQLKSAYPLVLQTPEGIVVYFSGNSDELSFISTGRPEIGGLEKVTYFLREHDGRRSLWMRTSAPTIPADLLNDREGGLRQETEILPEVEALSWEYFGAVRGRATDRNGQEWQESWSGKVTRQLPVAVRLSWRARLGTLPYEWHIEVPLNVRTPNSDLLASPQSGRRERRRFRSRDREND
jgi:general secretion pathway protein J